MPYDPSTGKWVDEDTTVESRVTGLLSKDNPYLKQAAAVGARQANKRGLLNSTMAVQASESARIGAALPIASQDASQAHQREQLGRQLQGSDVQQQRAITSTEGAQTKDIASREAMQRTDIAAGKELQGADIASRERLQATDIGSRERMQATDVEQNRWLAQFDATARERLQTLDSDTRKQMQALDIDAQQRIASMNVAASERADASRLAAQFESNYASMLATIMNNPDIPADSRQMFFDHAARVRESNVALLEQMYGIDLKWEVSP